MNSKGSRFFSLSVVVIVSAFFLGGCVVENGYEETEPDVSGGEEGTEQEGLGEIEAPGSEPQWIWADFCKSDADSKEKEKAGCTVN